MITFHQINNAIPASRRRIVSLWFGDVDRITLKNTPSFTGSAILATVYAVSGSFQYYLVFWSLAQKPLEIWTTDPEKVSVSEAPNFEKELFASLRSMGIELAAISPNSPSFSKSLIRIPVAYNDENDTMPAGLFAPPSQPSAPHSAMSDEDRNRLLKLIAQA